MEMELRQSPKMLGSEDREDCCKTSCEKHKLDESKKMNNIIEGIDSPEKAVHPWYEQPSLRSQISKAEKLIQSLDRDQVLANRKLVAKSSFERWNKMRWERDELEREERRIANDLKSKTRELTNKKLSLDKLLFSNKAYQPKIKDFYELGSEVDNNRLSFRILHGCKSLAEEKRLVSVIKASQKRSINCTKTSSSTTSLKFFYWYQRDLPYYNDYYINRDDDGDEDKKLLMDKSKLWDYKVERLIANAPVNGEIWNSLGSKKVVKCEVKLLNHEVDKKMTEKWEHSAKVKRFKRKNKEDEMQINYLWRKLNDVEQRKKEAFELLHNLRMQCNDVNI